MSIIKVKPKSKPRSILNELNEIPAFMNMKGQFEAMDKLSEKGTDLDIIPEGFGKYGYEANNPIPVNTILGSRIYLNNLKTTKGGEIEYERISSTFPSNIGNGVDEYQITENGKRIANLFICPYHKKKFYFSS